MLLFEMYMYFKLLRKEGEIMTMETKIDQILKIVTMNQQDIAELKRDVKVLKEDVAQLKEDVAQLKKDVAQLKKDVEQLKVRVTSLERSVFLIETEQGDRINALFDAREANENKHEEIKNLCLLIESKIQGTLFNHEKRIKKLEGNIVPIL